MKTTDTNSGNGGKASRRKSQISSNKGATTFDAAKESNSSRIIGLPYEQKPPAGHKAKTSKHNAGGSKDNYHHRTGNGFKHATNDKTEKSSSLKPINQAKKETPRFSMEQH